MTVATEPFAAGVAHDVAARAMTANTRRLTPVPNRLGASSKRVMSFKTVASMSRATIDFIAPRFATKLRCPFLDQSLAQGHAATARFQPSILAYERLRRLITMSLDRWRDRGLCR